MSAKRVIILAVISMGILFIPLLVMQFSEQVNWSFADFLIAGVWLVGINIFIDVLLRKCKSARCRFLSFFVLILVFIVIWIELAVGIFKTPWAGN